WRRVECGCGLRCIELEHVCRLPSGLPRSDRQSGKRGSVQGVVRESMIENGSEATKRKAFSFPFV
ncbi:hypothetical protein, partial [uncultured Parabacteroides sp.]|uniref:hypothetical protein n=1 Tax=uncultured Parabacteroides sp. TaxID=512312 RepID=UPI002804CD80